MVTLAFSVEADSFVIPWPMTASAVSALIRIPLKIILVSAVLHAILTKFILAMSDLVTNHTTISVL
jgi:hypothetical protein